MARKRGKPACHGANLISHRGGSSQAALASSADVPLSSVIKAEKYRRTNEQVITKLATTLGVAENAITRGA
jgi:hypothetical protein